MQFTNPAPDQIRQILASVRSIAVVGLSPNPARPSYRVAKGLQAYGYRIIPVRPLIAEVLGEKAWPDLESLPLRPRHGGAEPAGAGVAATHLLPQSADCVSNVSELRPDIVDVFRAPEHVPAIVDSCIRLGIKYLWLQDGVVHEAAARRASEAGIIVVMDRCLWRDRVQLGTGGAACEPRNNG